MPVEPMRLEDLDEVLAIERASFRSPWSRHAFLHELRRNAVAELWVFREPPPAREVLGYLCLWAVAGELHVTNLAVDPAHRRRGIARHLLAWVLAGHRTRGATRAFLEVRAGNVDALRLYEGLGFRRVGLRKGYYFDTGDDAILMEADLAVLLGAGAAASRNPGTG